MAEIQLVDPPSTATTSARHRWLALVVMCFTVLLISLDQTVLNVALPTLVKELHPSSSQLQWIADAYTLANAVLLLFGGALGDRYGRRRIFLVGVAIFGTGSLACALVHDANALIAARALTGVGAAFLMPATLSIVTSTFQGTERARAIGIWAGVGGIGTAAGPLLGGWLLGHFWWGSVFLINVPVAVIAFVGALTLVKESRGGQLQRLDPIGVGLSSLGLVALTYGLIEAPTERWGSPVVIGSLLLSAAFLAGFVAWDRRWDNPLLDLQLFRNRTFSSALGAVTAVFFAMFGVSFLLSQYIQFVQGVGVFGVGLRFLPLAIGALLGSNLAARLTEIFGLRAIILTGMLLVTTGLAIFATVSVDSGYLPVGLAFAAIGSGLGLAVAPASNAIMGTLAPGKIGAGAGLRSTVQLLGGSFGVAIIGSLAVSRYRNEVEQAFSGPLRAVPADARASIMSQIGDARVTASHLTPSVAHSVIAQTNDAFVSGMRLSATVAVAVMVLATIAAAVWIPTRGVPMHEAEPSGLAI